MRAVALFLSLYALFWAAPGLAQVVPATQQRVESRYFVFHSDLPLPQVQFYAAFSDVFLDAVDREFLGIVWPSKVDALVMPDKESYQRYYRQQIGGQPTEFGVYLHEKRLFVTYHGSGLGTFSHEIMHAVLFRSLPSTPNWAIEGVPAFFEKFWGYVENGRLQASWGYQNPWRLDALGARLKNLSLRQVIHSSSDTSEKRMLSVYLYQRGALKRFLELVRANDKRGYGTFLEAALDKPIKDIEPDWQAYLADVHARRDQLMKLPSTMVFGSKAALDQFAAQHGPLTK